MLTPEERMEKAREIAKVVYRLLPSGKPVQVQDNVEILGIALFYTLTYIWETAKKVNED